MNLKLRLNLGKKPSNQRLQLSELLKEKSFLANESLNPSRSSKSEKYLSNKNFLNAILKKLEEYPGVLIIFFFLKSFITESIRIAVSSINRNSENENELENTKKILCITHFVGTTSREFQETYFGNLLSNYHSRDIKYFFINHTKIRNSIITKYLNEKFLFDFKVSEKRFSYFEFLRLIHAQLDSIRRLSETSYFKLWKLNGGVQRPYSVIRSHFSRSAFNNLFLTSSILELVEKSSIEKILITFEGNAYESCLHNEIALSFPKIEFIFYQHAPITERHIGIRSQVNRNLDNILIGTSGKYTQELFKQYLEESNHKKIIVLGSNKSNLGKVQPPAEFKKVCLIAPEGTIPGVAEMLELGLGLAQQMQDFLFILRVHPVLQPNLKKIGEVYGHRHPNFKISSDVLVKDLQKSGVCIYRGSSVGIEGAGFGVVPVFYSKEGDYGMDPINFENRGNMQTNSLEKVVKVINSVEAMSPEEFSDLVYNLMNFNHSYFTPLNPLQP